MAHNGLTNVSALLSTNLKLPDASMVLDAGDWNGDGKGDLIARDTDKDRLVLYPGQGNAKYGAGVVMSTGWKTFVNLAAVGDVTGDGRPDLMGRVDGGKMTIFPSAGGAKFQAPILAPATMRTFNQIGSGLWRTASMPTTSVFNIGAFFVPTVDSRGKIPSPYTRVVGPGDVDGDGRADLVMRGQRRNALAGAGQGHGLRRPALPHLGIQRLHDLRVGGGETSRSKLYVGPLVLQTSGPRLFLRVAQQHQRAPAEQRTEERRHRVVGGRVHVGEQPHPGCVAGPRRLLEQLGLRARVVGVEPGRSVRRGRFQRHEDVALARPQDAVVQHARRQVAPRNRTANGSRAQATTWSASPCRSIVSGPQTTRSCATSASVVTESAELQAAPRNTGTSQCDGRSRSTVSPASRPSSSVNRFAVLLTQLA